MFNQKITFGKIQLNIKKDEKNDCNQSIDATESSGNHELFFWWYSFLWMEI